MGLRLGLVVLVGLVGSAVPTWSPSKAPTTYVPQTAIDGVAYCDSCSAGRRRRNSFIGIGRRRDPRRTVISPVPSVPDNCPVGTCCSNLAAVPGPPGTNYSTAVMVCGKTGVNVSSHEYSNHRRCEYLIVAPQNTRAAVVFEPKVQEIYPPFPTIAIEANEPPGGVCIYDWLTAFRGNTTTTSAALNLPGSRRESDWYLLPNHMII